VLFLINSKLVKWQRAKKLATGVYFIKIISTDNSKRPANHILPKTLKVLIFAKN